MSSNGTPPSGAGPPSGSAFLPARVGRFGRAVDLLHSDGRAAGFAAVRDELLEKYEVLKDDIPAAALIKLAIDADRHALFAEMAADKARGRDDVSLYDWFQRYLRGETDEVPNYAATGALTGQSVAIPLTQDDDEETDDGQSRDEA
jgi:hypothetical protein